MIALRTLCALALLVPAAAAAAGEHELDLRVEPSPVAIGQPFTVTLECVHAVGRAPRFDVLDMGELWWEHQPRRIVTMPLEGEPGRALTRARWQLVGIEPGAHELELPHARVRLDDAMQLLELPKLKIEVLGELAADEDQPRELAGFREPPAALPSALSGLTLVVGGLFVGFVVLIVVLIVRSARRKPRPQLCFEPSAAERLEALDASDEGLAREAFVLASHAVREAIDESAGEDLSGCTDEEWIEQRARSQRIPAARLKRAQELLRSAERVKYGMQQPTRWAVEECRSSVRAVLTDVVEEEVHS